MNAGNVTYEARTPEWLLLHPKELRSQIVGHMGELLVGLELLKLGCEVSYSSSYLPYDIIAVYKGRILRIQVKSTAGIRKNQYDEYIFTVDHHGKTKNISYDIIAFAAIDIGVISFLPLHAVPGGRAVFKKPTAQYHARRKGRNLGENSFEEAFSRFLNHEQNLLEHHKPLE